MKKFEPFQFDNFIIEDKNHAVVLDLSINRLSKNSRDDLSKILNAIDANLKLLLDETNRDNLRLVKMILGELSPVLLQKQSLEIVADFVMQNFSKFRKQKVLDFYLHPDIIYDIRDKIYALAEHNSYEGQIFLRKDASMDTCECKIVWGDGEIKYDSKKIVADIESMLEKG